MTRLTLAVALALAAAPALADDALEAAKADLAATFGPNAVELTVLPDGFFASTWAQTRAWLVDNTYTIPPKYRALIGLAVSSQISLPVLHLRRQHRGSRLRRHGG